MSKYPTDVPANSAIILWTRLHSKLTKASVVKASKLKRLDEARLEEIESGGKDPTISEVLTFSKIYKRPFAFFFLPEAPPSIPEIPDRRTGTGHGSDRGGDLSMAISRAYEIQNLIVEFEANFGTEIAKINPPPSLDRSNPEQLANWIRKQMGVEKVFGTNPLEPRAVLEKWIAAIETLGVIVLQETFSPKDSSAFSIGNLNPPVLVLCFKDAERRRLFSLFHELGHILLRQSAICDLSNRKSEGEERFCDRFAANFLMPKGEVLELSNSFDPRDPDSLAERVSTLSGASVESAFLRLVDLQIVKMAEYWERKPAWESAYTDWLRKQKSKKGGPNPNPVGTAIRKNGRTLASFVSEAFQAGRISRADASYIMRLPAVEIPNLIRRIR